MSHPSWADIYESVRSPTPDPSSSRSNAPGWHSNDADVTDFGPSRLDDDVEVVQCGDCGKVVLRDALGFHQENCRLIRDIAEGRLSPSIIEGEVRTLRSRRDSDVSDASSISQAQHALGGTRKKGAPDVDTQCGVINDKGLPCSRSLTCKSHSMGAKRAVLGRCKPYDELLLEWQKIHNPALVAKLEEKERALAAAKAASAERKQPVPMSNAEQAEQSKVNSAVAAQKRQEDPNSDMYTLGFNDEEVDTEFTELVSAIRAAVENERTRILPLAQRSFAGVYTHRAHTLRSCRELLREGLRSAAKATHAANFAYQPQVPTSAVNAAAMAAAAAATNHPMGMSLDPTGRPMNPVMMNQAR
ncbi:SCA7-domain-containing protein [Meira miltonrushii]|uniref:SCA7-domain-containing protein n=1 Tax=Meira miltonrushii TaxID=1280837 RepID=A0A316VLF7_9BASI|nr:SCA7-domain-containing protein [Meira miltonrushii]PWN38347.1 SCA7-domain-containing protein [Meira miltonrushii]